MDFGPHLLLALLEGVVGASILALTALGLSLTFGVLRMVNVAHGAFFMLGAVLAWWCVRLAAGFPMAGYALALTVAPVLVAAVALVADRLVLRRLGYAPESTIVATIGLLYIIQQVVLMVYGPEARSVPAPVEGTIFFPWFGYSAYKLVVVAVAAVALLGTWLFLARTSLGLLVRAVRSDAGIAPAFGIPVQRVCAAVFALGAGLAALAGVLVVPLRQAHYLMGEDPLLMSFVVVILGGLGNLPGTLLAAVLIGLGEGVVSVFFSPTLAKILATLLVALLLVFRPQGLFGNRTA